MSRRSFCEHCRQEVNYLLGSTVIKEEFKGNQYEYLGQKAVCPRCRSELHAAEVREHNLKAFSDAYRRVNGILSLEKIREIPHRYAIGKRPLSLLLGWGAMTFSRYWQGELPTRHYAGMLKRIYDDPAFYCELLEANKDKISELAYRKSKQKVQALLAHNPGISSQLDRIIQYFLHRCEDITPLALQAALYYAQGFYFAFAGEFLFDADCEAWAVGPVYTNVYSSYASYRFDPVEEAGSFDTVVLSNTENEILDSVARNLCCYSGKTLRQFARLEMPWLQTRKGLQANVHSNRIINRELIGMYFTLIKEKYNMLTPADIKAYARALFEQVSK